MLLKCNISRRPEAACKLEICHKSIADKGLFGYAFDNAQLAEFPDSLLLALQKHLYRSNELEVVRSYKVGSYSGV